MVVLDVFEGGGGDDEVCRGELMVGDEGDVGLEEADTEAAEGSGAPGGTGGEVDAEVVAVESGVGEQGGDEATSAAEVDDGDGIEAEAEAGAIGGPAEERGDVVARGGPGGFEDDAAGGGEGLDAFGGGEGGVVGVAVAVEVEVGPALGGVEGEVTVDRGGFEGEVHGGEIGLWGRGLQVLRGEGRVGGGVAGVWVPLVMNVIEKARSVAADLRKGKGNPAENWGLVSRLLSRLTNDQERVTQVTNARDVDGLDAILDKIEGRVVAATTAPLPEFTAEELDSAYRAFHKRLKIGRLADESKLGGRYMSGGRKSNIDAIQPPDGFPDKIWIALVRAGKLKDMGGGFFSEA